MKQSMFDINHLRQNNSGQDIVHSQFIKVAVVLLSFVIMTIFIIIGWLVIRDENLVSDSGLIVISETLLKSAIFAILIWKGANIIESCFVQRDRATNALKENELKFKSVINTSLIGIVEVNVDGSIPVANNEFLRITGYTHSCLQAGRLNWFDITPSNYQDIDKHNFSQAKESGGCTPYEKKLICADGRQITVKVSCTYLEEIKPSRYIVNVSQSNQIEQNLRHLISCQQPEELIKILYGEIAEQVNLDCYLFYLNDCNQGLRLTDYSGISCSQAKDLEWQKLGSAESNAIKIKNIEQSSQPNTQTLRNLGILAYYNSPLIVQGQLLGTIGFGSMTVSDFTSYEIDVMQAVCNQIAIAIQRTNLTNSLSQANRLKDEFLTILSHELRSPLNSILGWAQYLQIRKLDENTTSKALESIERNTKELYNTIEELLDMSRTIQGKMQLNMRDCDLAAILILVIKSLHSASFAKQIEIKLSVNQGLKMSKHIKNVAFTDYEQLLNHLASLNTISASPEATVSNSNFLVVGDNERLRQVIWHLLSNAIKFTSSGGCVEVRLLEEKTNEDSLSYAVIQVSDTGIGIDSEFLPYVFDRFRQRDSSNARAYNGLGLGLAIVRHIVELHGGSVCVESAGENKGSTFTVKLPLIESHQLQSVQNNSTSKFVVIN